MHDAMKNNINPNLMYPMSLATNVEPTTEQNINALSKNFFIAKFN
jgi:hypothetical protein